MNNPTYRIQNTCRTCKKVFALRAHDAGIEYYCNKDGSDRPKCGSVLMDEEFSRNDEGVKIKHLKGNDESFSKMWRENSVAWEKWEEDRRVDNIGICDDWTANE